MAKHTIKADQAAILNVFEVGSNWLIAKGASLTGSVGVHNDMVDDLNLTVAGQIADGGTGILGDGASQDLGPKNFSIDIRKTGQVAGTLYGISVVGHGASIDNDGLVTSEWNSAIDLTGNDVSLINRGKIACATGNALALSGAAFDIENDGLMISGGLFSAVSIIGMGSGSFSNGTDGSIVGGLKFYSNSSTITLSNKGRIVAAETDGIAVALGDGDDVFVNKGRIEGAIDLSGGDDTVTLARGKLFGAAVHGGDGNDTFVIGKNHIYIAEYDQGGYDTIKTARSFVLGDGEGNFIERLQAVGRGDIDLTGSLYRGTNLVGNDGSNTLTGGGGDDVLIGGKGSDYLYGNGGEDAFSFFEGDGADEIYHFEQGDDVIRLNLFSDIKTFSDLSGRVALSADEEDTVIDLGSGNRIVLVDFDQALKETDFKIIGDIIFP